MLKKYILLVCLFVSSLFAKEVSVKLEHPFYKDDLYEGNLENGRMNGNGIIYEIEKNKKIKFLEGYFENDNLIRGTFFREKELRNEIKNGIIDKVSYGKNSKPLILKKIYGNFNKPKNNKSFPSILNNNLNFDVEFSNTQSYDSMNGKLYIDDDELYLKGTLNLVNNKIKKVQATFEYDDLDICKGPIYITGEDFILDGYLKNTADLNNFVFEGVIRWNEGLEYYATNYRFKDNWFEQLDNLKKLATVTKSKSKIETTKIETNSINEVKESNKRNLKIDTSDVEYKNKQLDNESKTLDLEKK